MVALRIQQKAYYPNTSESVGSRDKKQAGRSGLMLSHIKSLILCSHPQRRHRPSCTISLNHLCRIQLNFSATYPHHSYPLISRRQWYPCNYMTLTYTELSSHCGLTRADSRDSLAIANKANTPIKCAVSTLFLKPICVFPQSQYILYTLQCIDLNGTDIVSLYLLT